jgi:hypothetical protein
MSTCEMKNSLFDRFSLSEHCTAPLATLPTMASRERRLDHGAVTLMREDAERFVAWVCLCLWDTPALSGVTVRDIFERLERGTPCTIGSIDVGNGAILVRLPGGICVVRPTGWIKCDKPGVKHPVMDWLHIEWAVTPPCDLYVVYDGRPGV